MILILYSFLGKRMILMSHPTYQKNQEKKLNRSLTPNTEPKTRWQQPFYKGFMYTAGVSLVILMASASATGIKLLWEDFEVFSILRPAPTSYSYPRFLRFIPCRHLPGFHRCRYSFRFYACRFHSCAITAQFRHFRI